MDSNAIINGVTNIISTLLELSLLVLFIIYVRKRKSFDGVLLLVSSILFVLENLIIYLGYNYLPEKYITHHSPNSPGIFDMCIRLYGILSTTLFTIGMFILILKHVLRNTSEFGK